MKQLLLATLAGLVIILSWSPSKADLVTYEFVNATAYFLIGTNDPFTINIAGNFVVDTDAQVVTSIDMTLSGFPTYLSSWNAH